nr:reverse transcriptase domain, reverse transcriptase zinc-binding domain protein [Tanacetum cinerariifolium]
MVHVELTYHKGEKNIKTSIKSSYVLEAAQEKQSVGLDSPSNIPFNSKAREKAISDPKNFYDHGMTQGPEILDCHGTSFDPSPIRNEAIIQGQFISRVES